MPISEANPDTLASAEYEFPNGYRHEFGTLGGLELYQIGEQLFDPSKAAVDANQQAPSSLLGLGQIVTTVLGNVEMDIRQAVGSNLVVTGVPACVKYPRSHIIRLFNRRSERHQRICRSTAARSVDPDAVVGQDEGHPLGRGARAHSSGLGRRLDSCFARLVPEFLVLAGRVPGSGQGISAEEVSVKW